MKPENLIDIDKSILKPGQRFIKIADGVFLPVGVGGSIPGGSIPGGGTDVEPRFGVAVDDGQGNIKFQPLSFTGTTPADSGASEDFTGYSYNTGKDEPVFPGGGGGGGGVSAEYYKCTSVDTATHTWAGNKAVLTEGIYTFETTETTGLTYTSVKPTIGKIYSSDALIKVGYLWEGDTLNTADTRFLLMPSRSNNEIVDIAKGGTGVTFTNHGVTVDSTDGAMQFKTGGQGYIEFPTKAFPEDVFQSTNTWALHIDFKPDEHQSPQTLFGKDGPMYFMFSLPNSLDPVQYINGGVASPFGTNRQIVTIDHYQEGGQWFGAVYANGRCLKTQNVTGGQFRDYPLGLGSYLSDRGRDFPSKMWMFMVEAKAYNSKDFTPPYIPGE